MRAPASGVIGGERLVAGLTVSVDAHPNVADVVVRVVRHEIDRLEAIFDPRDPDSEFSRWRRGVGGDLQSTDLTQVLTLSERFWVFSRGSFHPGAEPLRRRWRQAEADGVPPGRVEMRTLASGLELPYTTMHGPVLRTGDCSSVELSPLVRGYILDSALEAGWRLGLASGLVLRAGLDVRHRGTGAVRIDLTQFLGASTGRPEVIQLRDAALSGLVLDGRLGAAGAIDPHTGWPNQDVVAVAAVAPDAATAIVGAAIVGVRPESTGLPGCTWLAVSRGGVSRAEFWPFAGRTLPASA